MGESRLNWNVVPKHAKSDQNKRKKDVETTSKQANTRNNLSCSARLTILTRTWWRQGIFFFFFFFFFFDGVGEGKKEEEREKEKKKMPCLRCLPHLKDPLEVCVPAGPRAKRCARCARAGRKCVPVSARVVMKSCCI